MAKRQNFQFGSTSSNVDTQTVAELNNGWEELSILYSGVLNGVFQAISTYSYDSSQEIANAIQRLTGLQPTGTSTSELADALETMREEIETSSLTFKGYISTSAPSSSTYGLVIGNLWINSATLPTSFPVAAADIKKWDGTAWVDYGSTYTPADFDFFRNINDNEGYYWFGGQWTVMSTDMSTDYFTLNQTTGKWEISSAYNDTLVHKTGAETITSTKTFTANPVIAHGAAPALTLKNTDNDSTTAPSADEICQVVAVDKNDVWTGGLQVIHSTDSRAYVQLVARKQDGSTATALAIGFDANGNVFTVAPTPGASDNSTNLATTAWVRANMPSVSQVVPVGAIMPYGAGTAPSGYLLCNGAAVSRTTYSALFSIIGTAFGTGDGSTTFNLPDYTNRVAQGLGTGYVEAGLPDHNHSITTYNSLYPWAGNSGSTWQGTIAGVTGNASDSNPIYGKSNTVQPPATKSYWIIKY